jgi:hypothetical protein
METLNPRRWLPASQGTARKEKGLDPKIEALSSHHSVTGCDCRIT